MPSLYHEILAVLLVIFCVFAMVTKCDVFKEQDKLRKAKKCETNVYEVGLHVCYHEQATCFVYGDSVSCIAN